MANSVNGHVFVFPYPAPGHMMPLLDLTRHLATRGLSITILVTPKNLPILSSLLADHHCIQTLVLSFPADPALPPGAENVKDVPPFVIPAIMRSLHKLYDPIIDWFQNHPSPPSAIISDMFLWWTQGLALQLGIPRYMFSPSGVMAMLIIYSLRRNPPEGDVHDDPSTSISLSDVPNSSIYPSWQLRFLYSTTYVEGDPISEFMRNGVVANMDSHGLVFNSFSELEQVYVDHVMREAGHDRIWVVGPLLPINDDDKPNLSSEDETITWLNSCPDRTVVYICFGTQAVLSNTQMQAIASGLEKSGVRFILCVKGDPIGHPDDGYNMIPVGYEDRVAGRGLIIKKWAPQQRILSHRAVGAFLTHCGWNSVLEGLVGGVPMLTWPVEGEQFLNASLLVDELKVGMRVTEGAETVPDSNELARVVMEVISQERSEKVNAMQERVTELRGMALEAIREGGSSYKDLDGFVSHISQQKQ